ncbi:hypothetical protein Q0Z83_050920 [Actinoplanes sichuanensis]|uniref:Uncharacterized protein n=1 Tax=Actinoplanes sichuanensis TaxID=512349 RepID=A0ABW4AQ22_9ACTN|nr:hypothetical protein [Actinoplanes sichuanensis]BEL06901.1 hypothetical protein Q0Z83_050920 [Actinoplanes sichuanensis]
MTERLRQLLDDAVGELEPRDPDPVGSVLRRGRAARRRAVTAGVAGAAVAVLAVGAITTSGLIRNGPTPQPAEPRRTADATPTPLVIDGKIVAGALKMPVPPKWRALTTEQAASCVPQTWQTLVMVVPSGDGRCPKKQILVYGSGERSIDRMGRRQQDADGVVSMVTDPPVTITLPGGEPAWLAVDFDNRYLKPGIPTARNLMVMPWSQVTVHWLMDGPAQRTLVSTIRTTPTGAGVLRLPDTAADAYWSGPDGHGDLDDSAAVTGLIQTLRAQTDVVANADACANESQQTAEITFLPTAAPLTQFHSPADPTVFRVVISLGGGCQEAVSSHGGRVRLSDATVTELKTVFGIGAE